MATKTLKQAVIELRPIIQEMIIEGCTMVEIGELWDLHPSIIYLNFEPVKNNFKYIDFTPELVEEIELSIDGSSISFNKEYTLESLTDSEIKAYNKYELKNKAYYEIV